MRTILHIGAEKTGTTALQSSLAASRDVLAEKGICYPPVKNSAQHYPLALYAMAPGRSSVLGNRNRRYREEREAWDQEFEQWLADALADRPETLVLSSEVLGAQLVDQSEVQRLKALLDRYTESYAVVVYLRRQDRATMSLFSTDLRVGSAAEDVFGPHPFTPMGFDYARVLDLWSSVFGCDAVRPRVYERAVRSEGGLLGDLVEAVGLRVTAGDLTEAPPSANAALSAMAQRILLEYNRWCEGMPATTGPELAARHAVIGVVTRAYPGAPRRPARAEAEAYLARFAKDNDRVAREWFGGGPLFDDSFDSYPEHADPQPPLETADLIGVVAGLAEAKAAAEADARAAEAKLRRIRRRRAHSGKVG